MLIVCENCSSKMRVPDDAVGRKGKCPKCGVVLTIPAADGGIISSPSSEPVEPAPPPRPPTLPDEGITAVPPPERIEPSTPPLPPRPSRRARDDDDEDEDERGEHHRRSWRDDDEDEDDNRPMRRLRRKEEPIGLSLSSMIVGIVAVLSGTCLAVACGLFSTPVTIITGLVAIVLGIVGMRSGGRPYAIVGISLGAAGLLMALACGLLGGAVVGFHLMKH